MSWTRVKAILVKELGDYRRNRFVMVFTMTILPLIFIAAPTIQLLTAPDVAASSKLTARVGISLLYMLFVPAIVPSTVSAYSVIGEREQGTLEPILITPISREEFLVGKALAVLAGWSIWVGIAISARSSDVRVAQQLSVFANLPMLAFVALMTFDVITPSIGLALVLAAALLAVDALGWRAVAAMFDRERLITGARR